MKILIMVVSEIIYLTVLTLVQRKHEVYLTYHTDAQVKNIKK